MIFIIYLDSIYGLSFCGIGSNPSAFLPTLIETLQRPFRDLIET